MEIVTGILALASAVVGVLIGRAWEEASAKKRRQEDSAERQRDKRIQIVRAFHKSFIDAVKPDDKSYNRTWKLDSAIEMLKLETTILDPEMYSAVDQLRSQIRRHIHALDNSHHDKHYSRNQTINSFRASQRQIFDGLISWADTGDRKLFNRSINSLRNTESNLLRGEQFELSDDL